MTKLKNKGLLKVQTFLHSILEATLLFKEIVKASKKLYYSLISASI